MCHTFNGNKIFMAKNQYNQPPQYGYNQPQYRNYQQPQVVYVQQPRRSNGLGVAGFVLALLGLIFSWTVIVGGILWLLGLIFSFIGVFRRPKGLAIAGLVISVVTVAAIAILASALAK